MLVARDAGRNGTGVEKRRTLKVAFGGERREAIRLATKFPSMVCVNLIRVGFPLRRVTDPHHVVRTAANLVKVFGNQPGDDRLRARKFREHQSAERVFGRSTALGKDDTETVRHDQQHRMIDGLTRHHGCLRMAERNCRKDCVSFHSIDKRR